MDGERRDGRGKEGWEEVMVSDAGNPNKVGERNCCYYERWGRKEKVYTATLGRSRRLVTGEMQDQRCNNHDATEMMQEPGSVANTNTPVRWTK